MTPYYTSPTGDVVIYNADVRDALRALPDESVHCVVTSPPYWGLRDYGNPPSVWGGDSGCEHLWGIRILGRPFSGGNGSTSTIAGTVQANRKGSDQRHDGGTSQFCQKCNAWLGCYGLESTPEQYVEHSVEIFREVRRVLRNDATLWLNLGDAFSGGGGYSPDAPSNIAGSLSSQRGERGNKLFVSGNRRPAYGFKPKDLLLMPFRVALALQADGWWVRSVLPWLKRNCMPESVLDRPTTAIEYWFLLAKSLTYYWDGDAVRRNYNAGSIGRYTTPIQDVTPGARQPNGDVTRRERGKGIKQPNPMGRAFRNTDLWYDSLSALIAEQRAYLSHLERIRVDGGLLLDEDGNPLALDVCPQGFRGAHFATFGEDLIRPLIQAATSEHGCCSACGQPWRRIVERSGGTTGRSWHDHSDDLERGQSSRGMGDERVIAARAYENGDYKVRTLGWQPGCACAASVVPCTVLDPFGGSGTTALVARQLGRRAILIELNREYADMSIKRVEGQTPRLDLAVSEATP